MTVAFRCRCACVDADTDVCIGRELCTQHVHKRRNNAPFSIRPIHLQTQINAARVHKIACPHMLSHMVKCTQHRARNTRGTKSQTCSRPRSKLKGLPARQAQSPKRSFQSNKAMRQTVLSNMGSYPFQAKVQTTAKLQSPRSHVVSYPTCKDNNTRNARPSSCPPK